MHNIEGLHGLAACAFAEVVLSAHEDEAVGASIDFKTDIDEIGAGDHFGIGGFAATEEADERFVGVGHFQGVPDLFGGGSRTDFCGRGGDDAGIDRDEVGDEGDGDFFSGGEGEFLFDFREVPVLGDAVCARRFVALTEE